MIAEQVVRTGFLDSKHSQMNLRGGRMSQLQRQQDQEFRDIISRQKIDTSKKISSITELIRKREIDGGDILGTNQIQIQDFSIMKKYASSRVVRL